MRKEEQFTKFEGFSLFCCAFLFHVFTGSLPILASHCGNASWLAVLFYSFISLGLFGLYYLLLRMFEGKDILEINREILGPVFSKVTTLLLFVFLLIYCINNVCEAVDLLAINTYSHTRGIILGAAFLIMSYLIALYPIKGLARTTSVAVWISICSVALILGLAYNQYNAGYLTPILGYGVKPILYQGVMQLSNLHGVLLISLFLKHFSSTKAFGKSGFLAVNISNFFFVLSALFYSMFAPYQALVVRNAGLLDLAQSIYITRFFQRFESIFIIVACMGKIIVISLGALALKKTFAELFGVSHKYEKDSLFPLLLVVLFGAQALFNLPVLRDTVSYFLRNTSIYFILSLLAVWLVGGYLKKQSGGGRAIVKTASLLLICCMIAPLFSGCSQAEEPDEEIFAIVMGYDRSDAETLRITMKIMLEDKNSEGGGSSTGEEGSSSTPQNVFTVDAPCNIPAVDLINTVIPKHLSLLHVKMLVISEDLAREDIDMLITPIIRYNEIKSTIAVVVCDGSAEEYISARTSELIPFLPLETEMILKHNKGSASYLVRTMGDIYDTYTGSYGDPLVMYGGLTKEAREARAASEMKAGASDDPRGANATEISPGSSIGKNTPQEKGASSGESPESTAGQSESESESGQSQTSPGNNDMNGMPQTKKEPAQQDTSQQDTSQQEGADNNPSNQSEEEPDITQFDADKLDLESWEIGGNPHAPEDGQGVPQVYFDDPDIGYLMGYLPGQIPIKTAAETQIAGMAVLREKKMVGTLDTHFTRMFMLADGYFNGAVMTVRDPYKQDLYVIFYANSRQKNRVKTRIDDDGIAHIDIECFVQAELAIVQNTEKDYEKTEEKAILRQYTQDYLEAEMEKLIFKLQKEYDADSLQLGRYVSNNFATIQQWEEYNWRERYKDAQINVKVNLKL